jgi:hypothetical protein
VVIGNILQRIADAVGEILFADCAHALF